MIPLRTGTDAEFSACRLALEAIGFDEPTLLARHRMSSLSEFSRERELPAEADALEIATQLFLDCVTVPRRELEKRFPRAAVAAMDALGLLRPAPDGAVVSPVLLHPRGKVLLACDLMPGREGGPAEEPPDFVYPSMTADGKRFADLIPPTPCEAFLDMGAGNGVAALLAAGCSRESVGVDVNVRAVEFAEWNRRLNGLGNVRFLEGDLYAPVAERTFDRIVTHPPYVPSLEPRLVYQDGGVDGQQLARRVVEGLPRHLRPGGRFACLSMGVDGDEEPFEKRVRRWLGSAHAEFDVLFLEGLSIDPGHLARGAAVRSGGGRDEERAFLDEFRRRGLRRFVHGETHVFRHAEARTPLTVRRRRDERTPRGAVEWVHACERKLADEGPDWLLEARPATSPEARLVVEHRLEDGEFSASGYELRTAAPFPLRMDANVWLAHLVGSADGRTTSRDLFASLRENGAFAEGTSAQEFARLVGRLVAAGVLTVSELPPPPAGAPGTA